ncbi:MAG TPA: hypothetical protein VIK01_07880 [Polyangiaceae bacterium]
MSLRARLCLAFCLGCSCAALSCDDKPDKPPSTTPSAPNAAVAPEATVAPKPPGPPDFEIDTLSAKVGFERALLDKNDGRTMLQNLLKPTANFVDGQDVTLLVDRMAKLPWVVQFIDELGKLGAKHVIVKTETRKEFSGSLPFTPELSLKSPPECSVVAMVLEDRGTAVWKLAGGVATKHGKGMAGPDLSMTGDLIERGAKSCKQSTSLFVSAGPSVEWGLAYDLAASSKTLEKISLDTFVLLEETPVPGHKVEIKK